MHILVLEPYDDGSHQQFLDGLIEHSRHRFTRWGLPGRKWKWRMRGAALYFIQELKKALMNGGLDAEKIDLIFTSDMTALAAQPVKLSRTDPPHRSRSISISLPN